MEKQVLKWPSKALTEFFFFLIKYKIVWAESLSSGGSRSRSLVSFAGIKHTVMVFG